MAAELIRITLVKDEWTPLMKKLTPEQIQQTLSRAGNKVAHTVARNLTMASKWQSITDSIKVDQRGTRSMVKMAMKGIMLDSMEPHYVALKRGRNITKWVMAHSPLKMKTGKSHIRRGPRGGILFNNKWKSMLYVTPTPWIKKPMDKGLRTVDRTVRQEVNKLLNTR